MAARIVHNAKVQRPTVCNALDTVLVHSEAAARCLPRIAAMLNEAGVEMRCDHRALSMLGPAYGMNAVAAQPDDWGREFLALIAAIKIVDSLDDALDHIQTYGSGHSEAIVTDDEDAAQRFLTEVDAAAVYHNTSTRFTGWVAVRAGRRGWYQHPEISCPGAVGIARINFVQMDREGRWPNP